MLEVDLALAVVAGLDHELYGVAIAGSMPKTKVVQPCQAELTVHGLDAMQERLSPRSPECVRRRLHCHSRYASECALLIRSDHHQAAARIWLGAIDNSSARRSGKLPCMKHFTMCRLRVRCHH